MTFGKDHTLRAYVSDLHTLSYHESVDATLPIPLYSQATFASSCAGIDACSTMRTAH